TALRPPLPRAAPHGLDTVIIPNPPPRSSSCPSRRFRRLPAFTLHVGTHPHDARRSPPTMLGGGSCRLSLRHLRRTAKTVRGTAHTLRTVACRERCPAVLRDERFLGHGGSPSAGSELSKTSAERVGRVAEV